MMKKRSYYICEILLGLLITNGCIMAYKYTENAFAIGMIITIVTMCLTIVTKLTIAENAPSKIKYLFNALTLYYMYSCIVYFFLFYLKTIGSENKFNEAIIWNYSRLFNFSVACALLWVINSKAGANKLKYIITACFMMEILWVYKWLESITSMLSFQTISEILVLMALCIYIYIIEGECKAELGEGIGYCRAFIVFRVIEYSSMLLLSDREYFMLLYYNLQMMQVYCVLKGVLASCIEGPLTRRLNALQEAEGQIDSHNESSRMIVNLSHELKTPVNVIRSATDLLILDCQEEELNCEIKELKRDCNQVMNVVQRMIDIQKIKGGECTLRSKRYNLVVLFENVIDAFMKEYKEITVIFNPHEEEMYGVVDMKLLQQGLMQLLVTMLEWEGKEPIYIEMNRRDDQMASLTLFHTSNKEISRLLAKIKNFSHEEKMTDILNVQFLQEVLRLHNGSITYSDGTKYGQIEIQLPLNENPELIVTEINMNNVIELSEMIKYYHLVG